jgi:hypothetical protein
MQAARQTPDHELLCTHDNGVVYAPEHWVDYLGRLRPA